MLTATFFLQAPQQGTGIEFYLMMGLLMVVFYFFMIRPQQKKAKDAKKFRESLQKGTKVVTIGGAMPSVATVKDYPYSRPTYLYTSGEPTGTTKEFVDFCLSANGDSIVGKVGFVPKSQAK